MHAPSLRILNSECKLVADLDRYGERLVAAGITSMDELRLAHPKGSREQAKGALMPALEALRLIQSSPFVAVQFNAGSAALPVLRGYIALVLGGDPIEADALEQLG